MAEAFSREVIPTVLDEMFVKAEELQVKAENVLVTTMELENNIDGGNGYLFPVAHQCQEMANDCNASLLRWAELSSSKSFSLNYFKSISKSRTINNLEWSIV